MSAATESLRGREGKPGVRRLATRGGSFPALRSSPWLWAGCLSLGLCFWSFNSAADLWITGYYPGYEVSTMAASNIDFSVITHLIHFSLVPNNNGTLNSSANGLTSSACSQMVSLVHGAGRQALVCVGGASTEGYFLSATTPANLGLFITNLVNFVSTYGYDGVDVDWEPFNSSDTGQYTNFVNALRSGLNKLSGHKLLTVAAPAYAEYGDSPTAEFAMLASLQGQFDQINAMTYDLSGPYEGWVTWYNSPVYDGGYTFPSAPSELVPSINGAIMTNFLANGVPAGKLGVGHPFYGYAWTGGPGVTQPRQSWPSTNPPTDSAVTYSSIMSSYYSTNRYHWDSVAGAAYLSITNNPASSDMFISYDDEHSSQAKVSYARNLHLGGLMIWELTQDYISSAPTGQRMPLTTALKQALETPHIASVAISNRLLTLSFTTAPLGLYRVTWCTNLWLPAWHTLTNDLSGTGSNLWVTDPLPSTGPARFYRIQSPP